MEDLSRYDTSSRVLLFFYLIKLVFSQCLLPAVIARRMVVPKKNVILRETSVSIIVVARQTIAIVVTRSVAHLAASESRDT